jgi:hypothetical protein
MPWNLKNSAPAAAFYTRAVTPISATCGAVDALLCRTVQTRFSDLFSRRCRAEIAVQIPEDSFSYAGTGKDLILMLRQT